MRKETAINVIREPGKFEGEPTYVPYLWDVVMDGFSDTTAYDGDTPVDILIIDSDDVAKFPDLKGIYAVAVWESEQGFVNHRTFGAADELQDMIEALEAEYEDCEGDE